MARISPMALTDYQYNLYDDYLSQLDENLIKYSNQNSMSIKYWHIMVQESMNHNEVQIQHSYKNYVFDIYNFVPTLEMSPLTYSIGYGQTHDGTSNVATGNFTMFLIEKPLPGDLFQFYSTNDATDSNETFRITHVQYMRTSKNKLKLYQLEFETAPLYKNSVDNLRINNILYWDTESHRFINEEQYEQFTNMVDNRSILMHEINQFYNKENGFYSAASDASFEPRPLVFMNTILRKLKKEFSDLEVKPIFGVGSAEIGIDWILREDYWDTFTCLSQNPEQTGELFNMTGLSANDFADCPEELLEEIQHYKDLFDKVHELTLMLAPFISAEKMQDDTCFKNCCNALNANFVDECVQQSSIAFDELATGADGSPFPQLKTNLYLTSAELAPLWFSFQNGYGYRIHSEGRPGSPGYNDYINPEGII